jgi:hypothetical protein
MSADARRLGPALAMLGLGFALGILAQPAIVGHAQAAKRVFEIRTYTAPEGKLAALHARFRDHTTRLFEKHGMTNVGYWTPTDAPGSQNTLIYVIAHKDRDAAKRSWDAFRNDPEWVKAKTTSEANGPIVSKVESVFLQPTEYSPIK